MSQGATALAEPADVAASGRERRIYTRLSGDELQGLRLLRLKGGPELQIVDLSRGGALLESRVQMRPGAAVTFELKASGNLIEIPSEVLRCQLARFDRGTTLYRGACMFTEPVAIETLLRQSAAIAPAVAPTTPPPTPVDAAVAACAWQKIVVRYRDGALLKGYTLDFHPSRGLFSLWPSINAKASERMIVPLARLKALFFVRDFNGTPQHLEVPRTVEPGAGRRIEVTFFDNEVVKGTTLNYRPDGVGFFVLPLDGSSNNLRVFVLNAAVRHVRFPQV
jgi:hypothetical protein